MGSGYNQTNVAILGFHKCSSGSPPPVLGCVVSLRNPIGRPVNLVSAFDLAKFNSRVKNRCSCLAVNDPLTAEMKCVAVRPSRVTTRDPRATPPCFLPVHSKWIKLCTLATRPQNTRSYKCCSLMAETDTREDECFIAVFPVYQIPLCVLRKGTKFSCYLQKYGSNKSPHRVFADILVKVSQLTDPILHEQANYALTSPKAVSFTILRTSYAAVCASKASRSTRKGGQ
ncbi:hypothetical protein E2C01_029211 [Portunus trituberculatus]|uniref:Uncharacterized protein n=1 Tax=Portunus trituberculatus TaxID=210409 RepID=A0A5B7ERD0_PORTR|nr:hypothetical protein [Portunus trituberculatus]